MGEIDHKTECYLSYAEFRYDAVPAVYWAVSEKTDCMLVDWESGTWAEVM